MQNYYISFGQSHAHATPQGTCDKDTLYRIEANNHSEAHDKAFELFDKKWASVYTEADLPRAIEHFPKGVIN